jgi:hypothetical protein
VRRFHEAGIKNGLIATTDADCLYANDAGRVMISGFESNPYLDAGYGKLRAVNREGSDGLQIHWRTQHRMTIALLKKVAQKLFSHEHTDLEPDLPYTGGGYSVFRASTYACAGGHPPLVAAEDQQLGGRAQMLGGEIRKLEYEVYSYERVSERTSSQLSMGGNIGLLMESLASHGGPRVRPMQSYLDELTLKYALKLSQDYEDFCASNPELGAAIGQELYETLLELWPYFMAPHLDSAKSFRCLNLLMEEVPARLGSIQPNLSVVEAFEAVIEALDTEAGDYHAKAAGFRQLREADVRSAKGVYNFVHEILVPQYGLQVSGEGPETPYRYIGAFLKGIADRVSIEELLVPFFRCIEAELDPNSPLDLQNFNLLKAWAAEDPEGALNTHLADIILFPKFEDLQFYYERGQDEYIFTEAKRFIQKALSSMN